MKLSRISLAALIAASITLLPVANARPEGTPPAAVDDKGGKGGNGGKGSDDTTPTPPPTTPPTVDDKGGSSGNGGKGSDDTTPTTPPTLDDKGNNALHEISGKGSGKGGIVDSKGLQLPDSVKSDTKLQSLLTEAQKAREAFLTTQKDLLAKIKGATSDEKAAIKEQLKANQQKFLDDTKQLRADIADRLKELGVDLKTRGINAGEKEGGQHKRPGQ